MDKVFEQATVGIAGALQVLAFESGITSIYEADLRAATRRAVQTHLAQKVVVEAPVKLARWKVGAADIAVRKAKGAGYGAIAELKLWKDIAKIDETIWDAWKLASVQGVRRRVHPPDRRRPVVGVAVREAAPRAVGAGHVEYEDALAGPQRAHAWVDDHRRTARVARGPQDIPDRSRADPRHPR